MRANEGQPRQMSLDEALGQEGSGLEVEKWLKQIMTNRSEWLRRMALEGRLDDVRPVIERRGRDARGRPRRGTT